MRLHRWRRVCARKAAVTGPPRVHVESAPSLQLHPNWMYQRDTTDLEKTTVCRVAKRWLSIL
jgi:hypothetical protein